MKIDLIYPTSGNPTQPFGANPAFYSNPIYGGIKGHNGIDYLTNPYIITSLVTSSHFGFPFTSITAGTFRTPAALLTR